MTPNDFFDELQPLYRLYHNNQHEFVEPHYVDDTTRNHDWTLGGYKHYERVDRIEPSDDFQKSAEGGILEALQNRRSYDDSSTARPISRHELFTMLANSYGVKENGETRPIPSPGQLYPLEIYPLVIDSPDVDAGLYHYNPGQNVLERPADSEYIADRFAPFEEFIAENWYHLNDDHAVSMMIFITGIPNRSTVKYGERGYMFTLIEAGALVLAVQLAAQHLDIGSRAYAGFRFDKADELLGLTEQNQEWVITSVALTSRD